MSTAKVRFGSKVYKYSFKYPDNPTKENICMAISEAMVTQNMKSGYSRRSSSFRYFNLLMKTFDRSNIRETSDRDIPINIKTSSARRQAVIMNNNEHAMPDEEGGVKAMAWRVGYSFSSHLVIDIDSHEVNNLNDVVHYYSNLLGKTFRIIKTGGGYWLITCEAYDNHTAWLYDNCRLLSPNLDRSKMHEYITQLNTSRKSRGKVEFRSDDDVTKWYGYSGHGMFCRLFTVLSIVLGHHTLRMTKKSPDEIISEIYL